MINLTPYQDAARKAIDEHFIGRIVLPTGTGKTVIAVSSIEDTIENNPDNPTVHAVFSPRIMLAKQWIEKSARHLIKEKGFKVNYVNINSGGVSHTLEKTIMRWLAPILGAGIESVVSTTSPEKACEQIKLLKNQGYHVIVICTYHSNHVLVNSDVAFDTAWYDECHFMVTDNRFFEATKIKAARKYFMTATPRFTEPSLDSVSINETSMRNEEVYGPLLYKASPKEMIDVGAIVPPNIHVVVTDVDRFNKNEQDEYKLDTHAYKSIVRLMYDSYHKHNDQIKLDSISPDKISGKMMVVCNGQLTLMGIMENISKFQKQNPDIKIYALSSSYGIYINGKHILSTGNMNGAKEEFLQALNDLEDNEKAIILHVDMIAEGLDVPGITGVMYLRNLSQTKFLQNQGRACRLHITDRARLESEELTPLDWKNYVKPQCWTILPYCLDNGQELTRDHENIITSFLLDYGFNPWEKMKIDFLNPDQQEPAFDDGTVKRKLRSLEMKRARKLEHILYDREKRLKYLALQNGVEDEDDFFRKI